ncbi:MAG: hypothetical protein IT287_08400 [Bdellovibrionaceae bacterium]|nr:hypothetical protein [Pseudobdellovibrionaceae bacterium]
MAKKKKPIKAPKVKPVKAAKPAKAAKPVKVAKKPAAPAKKAPLKKAAPVKLAKVAKKMEAPLKKAEIKGIKPLKTVKEDLKKVVKAALPAKGAEVVKGKSEKVDKAAIKDVKKGKKGDATSEEVSASEPRPAERDVFLTDAEGRRLCKVKDCDQLSAVELYCRYHYLLFWKKIQNRKKILSEGKLEQYIEELTSRYPIKFLELIRKDLHTEADFMSAIQELDIDESSTLDEFEEDENFIDEVRGISAEAVDRGDEEF